MKKKIIRIVLAVMVMALALQSFAGCRKGDDEALDPTKTQLYIANSFGGVGDQWLKEVIAAFEQKYAGHEFEPGKAGVQVFLDNELVGAVSGTSLVSKMSSMRDDIFFTETVYYYDFVNANVVADITEIITDPLTEFGEDESIFDKLEPQTNA